MEEQTILESDGRSLRLTTKRVLLDRADKTGGDYMSIPLHKVASCSIRSRSAPILLVVAGLLALLAAWVIYVRPESGAGYGLLVLAVAFAAGYGASRRGVIEVESDGGAVIRMSTAGMSHAAAKKFGEALAGQLAKLG